MKTRAYLYVFFIGAGYITTVACSLLISRSVIRQEEVFNKYCSDGTHFCSCDNSDYGLYEMGFPFVSSRNIQLPCGKEATTEKYSINDFDREEPVGFYGNILFWSAAFFLGHKSLSSIKKRVKK